MQDEARDRRTCAAVPEDQEADGPSDVRRTHRGRLYDFECELVLP